jgi:DNA-binding MarR family transcriptional regulator
VNEQSNETRILIKAMLDLSNSRFFLPTKAFRELSILLTMYHDPELSQQNIATMTDLSVAMVNGYVKKLKEANLVNIHNKNKRDRVYKITSSGEQLLMEHLVGCSTEIVQLSYQIQQELKKRLTRSFVDLKNPKIVLFGAADTAQLVLAVLEEFENAVVMAIVDNDKKKWGRKFGPMVIQPPSIIDNMNHNCLIISSFACQNEIYDSISHYAEQGVLIIKLSTVGGN